MATKKGGLGKGLDALFVDNDATPDADGPVSELRISEIEPDRSQPRLDFDDAALAELADSISAHGVIQPILVRPLPEGGYRIVAGERRWRASHLAGKTTIPVVVRNLSEMEARAYALIENLQREDLNPVEEAQGYQQLMEMGGLTQEQVAQQIGRSRPAIANSLRLLSLPDDVLDLLRLGRITTGHAKAILSLSGDTLRSDVARRVAEEGLTVRQAERMAHNPMGQQSLPLPQTKSTTAAEVELSLQNALGVEVRVKYTDGRGTLSVDFYSKEQLFEFANKLGR